MPKKSHGHASHLKGQSPNTLNSDSESVPLYRQKTKRSKKGDALAGENEQPEIKHPHYLAPAHFELREDGTVQIAEADRQVRPTTEATQAAIAPELILSSDAPWVRLYRGNCLEGLTEC